MHLYRTKKSIPKITPKSALQEMLYDWARNTYVWDKIKQYQYLKSIINHMDVVFPIIQDNETLENTESEELQNTNVDKFWPIITNTDGLDIFNNNPGRGYLYVLIEREFVKEQKMILKVGMTEHYVPLKRTDQYPKNSKIYFIREVDNVKEREIILLYKLKNHKDVLHRRDIGREYFDCDINLVVKLAYETCDDKM
jgi:hypothetical protein